MSARPLRVGLSTCPNDTFLFHGLLTGRSDPHGLELEFVLGDVEELNQRLLHPADGGDLDLGKGSFAAALALGAERLVMPTGSALGFGVGPLLLQRATPPELPAPVERRMLCPGEHTTASLLLRLFHPGRGRTEQVIFSDILPALAAGTADEGVCIHEGRFTYAEHGLRCVEDLGQRWERETDAPLPLGGLFARRDLGPDVLARLQAALADSLAYGHAHREETVESMSRHAQEFSEEVLFQHVDLYVNDWTRDLGPQGRAALAELGRRALALGLVPADAAPLEVFTP